MSGDTKYGIELTRVAQAMRKARPEFCDRHEAGVEYHRGSMREHGMIGGWVASCTALADMLIGMGVRDEVTLIDFLSDCGAWHLYQGCIHDHLFSPWGTLVKAKEAD